MRDDVAARAVAAGLEPVKKMCQAHYFADAVTCCTTTKRVRHKRRLARAREKLRDAVDDQKRRAFVVVVVVALGEEKRAPRDQTFDALGARVRDAHQRRRRVRVVALVYVWSTARHRRGAAARGDVPRLRAVQRLTKDAARTQPVARHRAARVELCRAQRQRIGVVTARAEVLRRETVDVVLCAYVSFHVGERNAFFFTIRCDQTVEFEARHETVCVVIREPPAVAPPSGPRENVAVARGIQADGRTQTQGVRGSSSAFRSRLQKTLLLRVVLGERVEEERKRGVKRSSRLRGE